MIYSIFDDLLLSSCSFFLIDVMEEQVSTSLFILKFMAMFRLNYMLEISLAISENE